MMIAPRGLLQAFGHQPAITGGYGTNTMMGSTGADTLAAPGISPEFAAHIPGIFAGESGGDYNALFGFSNRDGGRFAGTNLTNMTVNDAINFSNPSGPYGQWVEGQIGRVATPMGAYQVVGTTLRAAMNGLGLTGDELMTPATQDRIGQWIYENQGIGAWEGYRAGASMPSGGTTFSSGGGTDTMTGGAGGDRMAGLLSTPQEPARRPSIWDRLEGVPILGGLADPDRRARLAIGLGGMSLNPNQMLMAMNAQGIQDRATERETAGRLNQTVAYLQSIGRDDLVGLAEIDPGAALATAMQPGPSELEQLQLAQAQLDYDQDLAGGPAGGVDYSQTPVYGVNANGETVLIQVGDNGTAVQTVLPSGVTVDRPGTLIDTGTEIIVRDPTTGEITSRIPKDPGGAAAATAQGTALGAATAAATLDLPATVAQADASLNLIDQIVSDPALGSITGGLQGRLPAGLPWITGGQAGSDLSVKIGQLQGQAFLQAFDSLRGSGSITEQEGIAATAAIARLKTVQSQEAYVASLSELRTIIETGKARAIATANAATATPGTSVLPPTGQDIAGVLNQSGDRVLTFDPATGEFR